MTVLEASLRKLVREEAGSAAVAVQEEFHNGLRDAILRTTLEAAREATQSAIEGIATYNKMVRPIMAPQPVAASVVKLNPGHDSHLLIDARYKALQLAIAHKPNDAIPTAAAFAQFMLDGVGVPVEEPAGAPVEQTVETLGASMRAVK